jgi:hypothetical protein
MKPHKHSELIKAWADGHEIQHFDNAFGWTNCSDSPAWKENIKYRIKPPDDMQIHMAIRYDEGVIASYTEQSNVKFIFDGETKKLKHVELI